MPVVGNKYVGTAVYIAKCPNIDLIDTVYIGDCYSSTSISTNSPKPQQTICIISEAIIRLKSCCGLKKYIYLSMVTRLSSSSSSLELAACIGKRLALSSTLILRISSNRIASLICFLIVSEVIGKALITSLLILLRRILLKVEKSDRETPVQRHQRLIFSSKEGTSLRL